MLKYSRRHAEWLSGRARFRRSRPCDSEMSTTPTSPLIKKPEPEFTCGREPATTVSTFPSSWSTPT
ncbi:hypothetical protein [Saccharopolyspora sp. 6M]|uniref:hypothetical protein n=1 Tax=Saccharopolyspora sp. 6M TaxID=2877237 RepID=UPI001CD7D202|nr:hypothetical protein [Saccharopolyspora sp. 6M]MCA1225480.1 hypothetical protein [Saccharopolyspora sp. 6M]